MVETQMESTRTLAGLADSALVSRHALIGQEIKELRDEQGRIEMELLTRMQERNATAIPDANFECSLESSVTYAQEAFTPLLEILPAYELKACYTPAHEETIQISAKWDTTKTKAVARRVGAEALRIVEQAKLEGAPRLVVKARKG